MLAVFMFALCKTDGGGSFGCGGGVGGSGGSDIDMSFCESCVCSLS